MQVETVGAGDGEGGNTGSRLAGSGGSGTRPPAQSAGTVPIDEYRATLMNAGFGVPEFDVHATQSLPGVGKVGSAYIRARKP